MWLRMFDALTPFAHSQSQAERMADAAIGAVKPGETWRSKSHKIRCTNKNCRCGGFGNEER
jgi:hypothetical protein